MTLQYFLKKIKDVKLKDYLAFGKLFVALLFKPMYKPRFNNCWVICETEFEARDNGYHFFKYIRKNHSDVSCYYAINMQSPDYAKVKKLGNIIQYGSIKHWILYLCAEYNISSQKGGKPNTAVCAFLELNNLIDSRFVFLQHGVTINNCAWAKAGTTQLRYFVTSTIQENKYIKRTFGFPPEKIILTGMPRFDNLHDCVVESNYVLIMPTWRSRFSLKSEMQNEDSIFKSSNYKKSWENLLNSLELKELINHYRLKVLFFPHRNIQSFLVDFDIHNENIIIADWRKYDIQDEMKKAAMMITDYSSVFFDMIYMKKPIVFYQFDYDDFRKYDYEEGYFNYKKNPFGDWCESCEDVLNSLKRNISHDFKPSQEFFAEYEKTFPYHDSNNSERIVKILKNQH